MSVLKFHSNKLFSFEDIKISVFLVLGLGLPNHVPLLRVLREFDPLNVVGHHTDPKRHILA